MQQPTVILYKSGTKHESPKKFILGKEEVITLSENDYVLIEIKSESLINQDAFIWLSDYRFDLTLIDHSISGYLYSINLSNFFVPEDLIKFSHRFPTEISSKYFYKIFLNYYGECSIEIEGLYNRGEFTELSKINVESDKISEIDSLLDYLLEKNHYYWNTVSLTKVEATERQKEQENIIWTLKKLDESLMILEQKFIPHITDAIARLIPNFAVSHLEDTSVITEDSLLWLIENCNYLEPSNVYEEQNFLVLNRPFKVKELLVQHLIKDTDVIENQVIHGFVNDIFVFYTTSLNSINKVLESINEFHDFKSQIFKSYYQRLRDAILKSEVILYSIKDRITQYIPVTKDHLNLAASNRFGSKQHYYDVYLEIAKWIARDEAVYSADELFSGAKDISKLYEVFCLFKIIDTLSNDFGYVLENVEDELTDIEDVYNFWGARQNSLSSIYHFKHRNKSERITLYYETLPNDLTTVAKSAGRGYRPDFILEIKKDSFESKFIILDAKYKRIGTIQNYDYQELTLKYLHGVGLKKGGYVPVLGLFILNPISNGKIGYYQKNEYTDRNQQISLPLIGRIEMSIIKNQHNYFADVLLKVLAIE